jgi:hypothetical protein
LDAEPTRETHLHVHLVPTQHDRDIFTDSLEITVPIGDVFVGDSRCDVKHDDTALALDVVSITETTELFLARSIPYIEADSAIIGGELEWVDFDTKGCWYEKTGEKRGLVARSDHREIE